MTGDGLAGPFPTWDAAYAHAVGSSALSFMARAQPRPQGSKRLGRNRRTGGPVIIEDNPAALRAWRAEVVAAAAAEMRRQGWATLDRPCEVRIRFWLPSPKRPRWGVPGVKPDLDKLGRAVLDALSDARVFRDDARVIDLVMSKRYAGPGVWLGASIVVTPWSGDLTPDPSGHMMAL